MQKCKKTDYQKIEYELTKLDSQIIFRLVQRFRYKALAQTIKSRNYYATVNGFYLMLEPRKLW